MTSRVERAIELLLAAGGTQLVVTHGGPIRAVCAALLDLRPGALAPVAPGSLTVIHVTDRPRPHTYNLAGRPTPTDASD